MAITSFKNKTVIITGASAGVGAACATLFAELGANLVLVARGEKALTEFADSLVSDCFAKDKILSMALDVSNEANCRQLVEAAKDRFGSIDCLINNAGAHYRGNFSDQEPAKMVNMVDINLRTPILLTGMVLPEMIKAGEGAVVMVGSLAGRMPMQGASTYASTKAGLRAFAYSLADEVQGLGVSVGVVSPGPIDTGFIMDHIDEVEDIVYSQPMSTTVQVAQAILQVALGKEVEVALPKASGLLTNIGYLFPWFRRKVRPSLYAKGRKNKEKYRRDNGTL